MARYNYRDMFYAWTFLSLATQTTTLLPPHQFPLAATSLHPSSGCGLPPSSPPGHTQNFTLHSAHGGGLREYLLHLPPHYDPHYPHPLILSYHGFTQNMHHQERISQLSNATVNPHAIAVYPQALGAPPAWQGAPYSPPNVSDLAFSADLIAHLRASYCVDERRVFATGMSNGGGFVNTLACSPEGRGIAAFAAVAGAFYGDVPGGKGKGLECEPVPRGPVPILEIHGDRDSIIPYWGGVASGVNVPAIPDWLRRWAIRDGCAERVEGHVRDLVSGNVRQTTYSCNGSHGVVTGLRVRGMGHVWPSTKPNDDNNCEGTWIDAAPFILDFFKRRHAA